SSRGPAFPPDRLMDKPVRIPIKASTAPPPSVQRGFRLSNASPPEPRLVPGLPLGCFLSDMTCPLAKSLAELRIRLKLLLDVLFPFAPSLAHAGEGEGRGISYAPGSWHKPFVIVVGEGGSQGLLKDVSGPCRQVGAVDVIKHLLTVLRQFLVP